MILHLKVTFVFLEYFSTLRLLAGGKPFFKYHTVNVVVFLFVHLLFSL